MKIIFVSLFLLLTQSVFARNFNFSTDSLCFRNADKELQKFGPLGKLGSKKGVCQGMSGIVSAFYEHASFNPNKAKLTSSEAYWAMMELRRYHSGGCSKSKKVAIDGYRNLNEFCLAHKDLLMENAVSYNADIAVREISWNLDSFLYYQDDGIDSKYARKKLHLTILSFEKKLNAGKWPLMLYYSHVVGVHHMTKVLDKGKIVKIKLGVYDSNYSSSQLYTIEYSTDGLPKSGQKMIWDITPSRLTTVCW